MAKRSLLSDLLVIVLIFGLSLITWRLLDVQRSERFTANIQRDIDFALDLLERDLAARVAVLSLTAQYWERGTPSNAAQFAKNAKLHMENIPGAWALAYADEDLIVRKIEPEGFQSFVGRSVAASEERRSALENAKTTRQLVISDPVDLLDDTGRGFLMYLPLFQKDAFQGILIVVFNTDTWIASVFNDGANEQSLRSFALQLSINGKKAFETPDFATTPPEHTALSNDVWQSTPLEISARPRPYYYENNWHMTPESKAAIILLTLSAMASLASVVRRARLAEASARDTAEELIGVNANLRREAEVRRRAEAESERARGGDSTVSGNDES